MPAEAGSYYLTGDVELSGAWNVTGTVDISGNADRQGGSGVYLTEGATVRLTGALTNAAPISISMQVPGVFTGGSTDTLKASDYLDRFASGDDAYTVAKNGSELMLRQKIFTISFDTDHGTLIEPITGEYGSKVTAPENPTKPGYAFKGCAQLEKLRLPKDCAIDETAFDGCKALAIYAPAGGTVEDFCEAQGISFVPETAKETRKTLC